MMSNDIMLSVIMLNVVMLNVVMLSVIMVNVVMLSAIMLNVVMLSVVAPFKMIHALTAIRQHRPCPESMTLVLIVTFSFPSCGFSKK